MTRKPKTSKPKNAPAFNIMIVGQNGRLAYEAVLFAASLRRSDPGFKGRLVVAEPQPGPKWQADPTIRDKEIRTLLTDEFGAEIVPFASKEFGQSYAYGNKIEGLFALPADEPFVFFDTDTLITGPLGRVPFDFDRPTASLRRENTWPNIELYGPTLSEIWGALYAKFGLDFESSQDPGQPQDYWQRYLYFNAGWFFYRCPQVFARRFLDYATSIRDDPPKELICQEMHPWLDQIALPLVLHSLKGGRNTIPPGLLDGAVSCHYRVFPLLYARETDKVVKLVEEIVAPNRVKKVVKRYEPIQKMVLQGRGQKVRALFDQNDLPRREQMIRNKIKREGLWMR